MTGTAVLENPGSGPIEFGDRQRPAWERAGMALTGDLSVSEALVTAGLDWQVVKKPLWVRSADGKSTVRVPNKFAVVKTGEELYEPLGVVGSDYQTYQNEEALAFGDAFRGQTGAQISSAGVRGGGKNVWLSFKLPQAHSLTVGGGNPVDMYLIVMTSHDGTRKIRAIVCPVNMWCMNQMRLALSTAEAEWSVRHVRAAQEKLLAAAAAVDGLSHYATAFKDTADALAKEKMNEEQFKQFAKELLPDRPRTERVIEDMAALFVGSPTVQEQPKSAWRALNAVTEYFDWTRPVRTEEARLNGTWDGVGSRMRNRALELLLPAAA